MRTPTAFERERAEGEGAFFGRSITSEKKVRRPVKRERTRQSHPGYFLCKKFKMFYTRTKDVCLIVHLIYNVL